jgi:hypothetical protein
MAKLIKAFIRFDYQIAVFNQMTWSDVGKWVDRKLRGFVQGRYIPPGE